MTFSIILLILLAAVFAAGLSYFQYYYKAGTRSKATLLPAFLRFLSIFVLLLLLINPRITTTNYQIEKTPLPLIIDNSESVAELGADGQTLELYNKLADDARLQDKFDLRSYRFDSEFAQSDSFSFKGSQTNIEQVAKNLRSIHRNKAFPVILISDGNQTTGADYVYAFGEQIRVHALVPGDTTTYPDLRISQLNVNKYAFLKNKFPAEVFLQYTGNKSLNATLTVNGSTGTVAKQSIQLSPSKRSAVVNLLLPADKTGLQVFKANVTSAETEKNTYNNVKNFAVEVIDQKTEVAIVSTINHPDLGALKRAIETNAQRKVTIVKPSELRDIDRFNVVICYQPNASFKNVFEGLNRAGVNRMIISGVSTDFNFLNSSQTDLQFKVSNQREDYLPVYESGFNLFATDDIGFGSLPPLQHGFGNVVVKGELNVLLKSRIRNIETGMPLLAFAEGNGSRSAYLLGENIWKWRLQSHADLGSFDKFDGLIDKTIQFLSSDNKRRSLIVQHERFYNSGENIEITAQFFNKNYEFDEKARLTIGVTNLETKQSRRYDLLKGANSFKTDLSGLPAGKYAFEVIELNSKSKYTAGFEILEFNIEKQFVSPDVKKIRQLILQTGGETYMPDQLTAMVDALLGDERYKPVQRAVVSRIPLIESVYLLILLAISLAAEWFIRKYNGML